MRWSDLSLESRCSIVAALARHLHKNPPWEFEVWGVTSVGFGWRTYERDAGRISRRSPVLVLVVPRKLPSESLASGEKISRSLNIRRVINGVEVALKVPVDVCRRGSAARAHSPRLTPQIAGGWRYGTACVILEDEEGRRWILSCHHVIGDSNINPSLEPNTAVGLSVGSNIQLGVGRRFGPLSAGASDCVDAALARIVSRHPVSTDIWSFYPSGYPDSFAYWSEARAEAKMFCTGLVVPLRFLRVEFDRQVRYLGGGRAYIREVAIFEVTRAGSRPAGGDSGAPVVSVNGQWLGMYIGGGLMTIDGAQRRVAVVIPPHVILEEPSLGVTLELSE